MISEVLAQCTIDIVGMFLPAFMVMVAVAWAVSFFRYK